MFFALLVFLAVLSLGFLVIWSSVEATFADDCTEKLDADLAKFIGPQENR